MRLVPTFGKRPNPLLDADGIADLYARRSTPLLRYFMQRVLEPELAADLMAETFAEILDSRHTFKGQTAAELDGWMYAIARHKFFGYLRRGSVEKKALARVGIDPPHLTPEEHERVEALADLAGARELITEALADLNADQQEALRLRVVEELSYSEVAAQLGVSEQTARARVSRGLRAMASALDGRLTAEGVTP